MGKKYITNFKYCNAIFQLIFFAWDALDHLLIHQSDASFWFAAQLILSRATLIPIAYQLYQNYPNWWILPAVLVWFGVTPYLAKQEDSLHFVHHRTAWKTHFSVVIPNFIAFIMMD